MFQGREYGVRQRFSSDQDRAWARWQSRFADLLTLAHERLLRAECVEGPPECSHHPMLKDGKVDTVAQRLMNKAPLLLLHSYQGHLDRRTQNQQSHYGYDRREHDGEEDPAQ